MTHSPSQELNRTDAPILVTGGGGFIGGGIVGALLEQGHRVRSFSRREHLPLKNLGVECAVGDLSDRDAVIAAAEDCSLIFHVAALAGVWGNRDEYWATNVTGTEHVLDACRVHSIDRLVFTSSPSVTFAGLDQQGIDESEPYPEKYLAEYPRTKAEAERRVRNAANRRLATVSLRPHLVWGPNDPHFLPRLIDRARRGKLRLVGDGRSRVDSTYIDNAVIAHLNAAARLFPDSPISGRAYFISNGEPLPVGDLLSRLLGAAGLPPITRTVPTPLAVSLGGILEGVYRVLRRKQEPPITRFVARQLSTDHWFDLSAARRDLGYLPEVTIEEGINRVRTHLSGTEEKLAQPEPAP